MERDDRIKELIIDYTEGRRSLDEVVDKIKDAFYLCGKPCIHAECAIYMNGCRGK